MAEKSLSAYVMRNMKLHWEHGNRHEDSVSIGVADVSYYLNGNGWIELKSINKAPVREATPMRMSHWTEAQHNFITKRRGWLLIRVLQPKRIYMLFRYDNLPPWERDREWPLYNFEYNAFTVWQGAIHWSEFAGIIRVHG